MVQLIVLYGKPCALRLDNGSELTSLAFTGWCGAQKIELHFIQPVMDAYADGVGLRWGVNARREVFASADPTVPTWHIIPGAGELGTSTDRMVGKATSHAD